ncbi:MAG: ureidoacrylate peracid hydrolase [Alphaproteobacteria bacterium]|jgi:nicotinamidase-related amidase|nr:ureidoacrylate peracid hydrolase [Alphaproteobacteria bacterium]
MANRFGSAIGLLAGVLAFAGVGLAGAQELPKLPALDKTLKPEQTAIVVVDFQNSFAEPKGEHYPRLEKQFKETNMIENSLNLVKQARALGIPVIHVIEGYSNDYSELDWGNGADFHRSQILRQAWKSTAWMSQLYEPMKDDKDLVLKDRKTLSGFGGNGLDTILKSRGIRNVAVMGFTADVCVYATAVAAYDLGYRVFSLTDAMVAADSALTKEMLRYSFPKISRAMTTKEFLGMFPAREASATTGGK